MTDFDFVLTEVRTIGGQVAVSEQLLDAADTQITVYLAESLMDVLRPGGMPFDRHIHWHGSHTWRRPGLEDSPGVMVAEDRHGNPNLWDGRLADWMADWIGELGYWPRRYDEEF